MAWEPDYATAQQLAAYLRITDQLDDAQLALAVTAASRAVDAHCHRQFGKLDTPAARYYTAHHDRGRRRWVVPIDDLMTATGLQLRADLDGDGVYSDVIDAFVLRPANAAADARPWTSVEVLPSSTAVPDARDAGVEVVAAFGWTAVPTPVVNATLLQGSRFHNRRTSPYGVAGSPDLGSELRLLAKVDPDVAVMLSTRGLVRWWAAA